MLPPNNMKPTNNMRSNVLPKTTESNYGKFDCCFKKYAVYLKHPSNFKLNKQYFLQYY